MGRSARARRSEPTFAGIEAALETTLADQAVLLIFGERNDPLGFAHRWRSHFPSAASVVVPRGNHFPMCDDPERFADAVRRFIRGGPVS